MIIKQISGSYQIKDFETDIFFIVNVSLNSASIQLPYALNKSEYFIKITGSYDFTILSKGLDRIEGINNSITIRNSFEKIRIISNQNDWIILDNNSKNYKKEFLINNITSFTSDRRPIKVIHAYNGTATHPRGLATNMQTATDYQTTLFNTLTSSYAAGFRRFSLHVPAGRQSGQTGFGWFHWKYLPDDVRAMLVWNLPQWLKDHSDAVIFPYMGFQVEGSNRFHINYNTSSPPSQDQWDEAVEPWLALSPQPGQVGIGCDASAQNGYFNYLLNYAEQMKQRGIWVVGEAIPDSPTGASQPLDYAYQMPFWTIYDYITTIARPLRATWTFSSASTEFILGFQNGDISSSAQALEWKNKGYVLASWGTTQDNYVLTASLGL